MKRFIGSKVFFDTNILAYLFDEHEKAKREKAEELLKSWMPTRRMAVSTQVLQELYVVLTRKLKPPLTANQAREFLKNLAEVEVQVIDVEKIFKAIDISERYMISFWDSLIICAAKESGCDLVFTEDMNEGEIEGVQVKNPF